MPRHITIQDTGSFLLTSSYLTDSASFTNRISNISASGGGVSIDAFTQFTESINNRNNNVFISQSNYTSTSSFHVFTQSLSDILIRNSYTDIQSASFSITGSGLIRNKLAIGNINTASVLLHISVDNDNGITEGVDPVVFVDAGNDNQYAAEYKGNNTFTGFLVSNNNNTGIPFIQFWNTFRSKLWTTVLAVDNSFIIKEGNAFGSNRITIKEGGDLLIGNITSSIVLLDSIKSGSFNYSIPNNSGSFVLSVNNILPDGMGNVNINTGSIINGLLSESIFNSYTQSINISLSNIFISQSNYTSTSSFQTFTQSINAWSSSLVIPNTSSLQTQISNVFTSQSRYTLTSSFQPFTSSIHTFTSSINAWSSSLVIPNTSSLQTQITNVFVSQSNYTLTSSFQPFTSSIHTFTSSINAWSSSLVLGSTIQMGTLDIITGSATGASISGGLLILQSATTSSYGLLSPSDKLKIDIDFSLYNLGSGSRIVRQIDSQSVGFKSFTSGSGIIISSSDDEINIQTTDIISFNNQTGTSYTMSLSDSGKEIWMDNASSNILFIPTNASVPFNIGTQILIYQRGVGQTSISGSSGVTIESADSALKLRVRYSKASLTKIETNTWNLSGDITT